MQKVEESDLAKMFLKKEDLMMTDEERFFVDRDGDIFCHMLGVLRNDMNLISLEDKLKDNMLKEELKFWKIFSKHSLVRKMQERFN